MVGANVAKSPSPNFRRKDEHADEIRFLSPPLHELVNMSSPALTLDSRRSDSMSCLALFIP